MLDAALPKDNIFSSLSLGNNDLISSEKIFSGVPASTA